MEWIRINQSTELPKEQQVFLADKMDDSFFVFLVGERPFDRGPREVWVDGGGVMPLEDFTHYCIPTQPKD